ncbi:MAG: cytidylate kinase-like family protein [Clostridia bacterium]|nr:cytidylate kinase-like family protein [Clostridia bacterium]
MADNKVITIMRGYGSGGRTIGKMLAEDLGWNYYDRELLRLASDESGISEELFARADETAKRSLLSLFRFQKDFLDGQVISPRSEDFLSGENLFRYQAKIIRHLAETENCVIVGRCANYILADHTNVVNVYVHAPEKVCIRTVMNLYGMSREDAEKKIRDTDKQRSDYVRQYTGRDWKCADDYNLCIDSSKMEWKECIRIVKAYLSCMA